MSAALLGAASVDLTDLAYALPGCRHTIDLNKDAFPGGTEVRAVELNWFDPPKDESWEVVLAADVVWLVELVEALVSTLASLLAPAPKNEWGKEEGATHKVALLAYQRRGRDADAELWSRLKAAGISVEGPLEFSPPAVIDGSLSGLKTDIGLFVLRIQAQFST